MYSSTPIQINENEIDKCRHNVAGLVMVDSWDQISLAKII